jgi:hypothetical protein
MVKRKVTKRKRKVTKRKRKFGMGAALKYGHKVAEMLPLITSGKYVGALKKIKKIETGIQALTGKLKTIKGLQQMPPVFTNFMQPLLTGLETDLTRVEGFATTKGAIETTKEALKKMGEDEVTLTAEYATAKKKILDMMQNPPNQKIKEMQEIINKAPFIPVKAGLRKSLPSALLLFLIEDKETPDTNKALAKFTVEKIKAAKAAATSATTTPATSAIAKASFGKRKRKRKVKRKKVYKKLPAALKRMCKKYKVRLTVKRNGKRVYKSEKVLKKQCKNALKRRKK